MQESYVVSYAPHGCLGSIGAFGLIIVVQGQLAPAKEPQPPLEQDDPEVAADDIP